MPDYSVAEFRHETFICTEAIPNGRDRFRVFLWQGSAYKGHQKVSAFLQKHNKGDVEVKVDEATGDVKITIGTQSIEGHIPKL